MCLFSINYKTKKQAEEALKNPLIAKKDIIVYKRLHKKKGTSPCQLFPYKKGYEYTEHSFLEDNKVAFLCLNKNNYYFTKHIGFHAYLNKETAESHTYHFEKIVEMIIPKGAKYFLGEDDEIVANRIIYY